MYTDDHATSIVPIPFEPVTKLKLPSSLDPKKGPKPKHDPSSWRKRKTSLSITELQKDLSGIKATKDTKHSDDFRNFDLLINASRPNRTNTAQLKYCPGKHCKRYHSIEKFRLNLNMHDERDRYCSACNNRKRTEMKRRREEWYNRKAELKITTSSFDALESIFENTGVKNIGLDDYTDDKFSSFINEATKSSNVATRKSAFKYNRDNTLKVLNDSIVNAELRYNESVDIDSEDLLSLLQQQDWKCALSSNEFVGLHSNLSSSQKTNLIVLDKVNPKLRLTLNNACLISSDMMHSKYATLR